MKMRCAAVAEPMLTSIRPRRRSMSPSSTGSSASSPRRGQQRAGAGGLPGRPRVAGRRVLSARRAGRRWAWSTRRLARRRRAPTTYAPRRSARVATTLQCGDDLRVGPVGGGGPVPGLPVRVAETAEGLGQRPVHPRRCSARGRLVHRRAHQRMSYPHRVVLVADEESGGRGLLPERARRRPRAAAAWRSDGQVPVSSAAATSSIDCTGGGQPPARSRNASSTPAGQVQLRGQRRGSAELCRAQLRRQLEQRQWVPAASRR